MGEVNQGGLEFGSVLPTIMHVWRDKSITAPGESDWTCIKTVYLFIEWHSESSLPVCFAAPN